MSDVLMLTEPIIFKGKRYTPGDRIRLSPTDQQDLLEITNLVPGTGIQRCLNRDEDLKTLPLNKLDAVRTDSLQYRFSFQFGVSLAEVRDWPRDKLVAEIKKRHQWHIAQKATSQSSSRKACLSTSVTTPRGRPRSTRPLWLK